MNIVDSKERDLSTADKIGKTVHFYSKSLLLQWRSVIWPLVRYHVEKPVFIVGCSRAGTTVVYKVLSRARELASLQKESHEFWNSLHPPEERDWDSHELGAGDVSERDRIEVGRYFFRHLGNRRFVDKANQNCFRIPYLYELFPDAMFLYVKRDGRDNINSLIHGWARPDEFGGWTHDLPAKVEIGNGVYGRWCFFLFQGWRSFLKASVEEVCAQQWVRANESILSAKPGIPPSQWVEMYYEDILRSPVEAFHRVFVQLEVPFDSEAREHCNNLLGNPYNAFSPPRLDKWKKENRERIERVIPALQETMMRMGYRIS